MVSNHLAFAIYRTFDCDAEVSGIGIAVKLKVVLKKLARNKYLILYIFGECGLRVFGRVLIRW